MTTTILATLALAATVEDQVRCAELAFSRSAEIRDTGSFESFLEEDARFTGATVLRGREQVLQGWAPYLAPGGPGIRWAPDSVEVLASGELALSQGPYEIRIQDPAGEVQRLVGRFFSVWRRQGDGSWKIVFDGGTPPSPADGDPFATLDYDPSTICQTG